MKDKDLISIKGLEVGEIEEIFVLADKLKKDRQKFSTVLKGKSLGLIFQKPSARTRVSIEVGIFQLGGQAIYLGEEIGLGRRESIADIAQTLSRYLDGIVARTFSHNDVVELAKYAKIPVINGLTDLLHPCQGLSDLYTIRQKKGRLKGLKLAYVGDGNNVLHSLLYGASKMGLELSLATPRGYEPIGEVVNEAVNISKESGSTISISNDPIEAVADSDIVYTDVWISMGQERQRQQRLEAFRGFQVDSGLVSRAKEDCLIMHCLPARRGEEIADEVIDGPRSIVFDQAENRLYVQNAILILLLGGK